MPNGSPNITVLRPGDTGKPDPFTILIIANSALEAPWKSGQFLPDPIVSNPGAFQLSTRYIEAALFGNLPGQSERLLADPQIEPQVRLMALFVPGLPAGDTNSMIGQDSESNVLVARRDAFRPFLQRYGLDADVAYAVSGSQSHTRASAWFTSDDDDRPGVAFTLDGATFYHRYYCRVPGTVAVHATATSLTALHEFGHALSSYSNGMVVDLYVDSGPGLNCKRGRPIPTNFATYKGALLAADPTRDSLGYPGSWQSYHCELLAPGFPAVMDDYWQSPDHVPEHCQHDAITRTFLLDRLRAKISR